MNFIKHVSTDFIELYPTSKLHWQSNKIYPSLQHFNWMRSLELKKKPEVFNKLGHINLKLFKGLLIDNNVFRKW